MNMRKLFAALCCALAVAAVGAGSVSAQNEAGDSLVNVQISDVNVLVPVSVAANLCDISVNVLARQLNVGDRVSCTASAESIATPGSGGNQGGGNQAGNSLVNVQIDDLTVALPIAIAANVCDVDVNVLAVQLNLPGRVTCEAAATSET
jgi:hypothetical protein